MNRAELLQVLSKETSLSNLELSLILASAPYRYKSYKIPKRTGGLREIRQPTPEVKAIQSWVVRRIISSLPVHAGVYSYRRDLGIRDHAAVHVHSNYFLRLDFADFFPSITYTDVFTMLLDAARLNIVQLDESAIDVVARIVCCAGKKSLPAIASNLALSIGAPSSPAISNAILYKLDKELEEIAIGHNALYSRYADDIYFSTSKPQKLSEILPLVRQAIANISYPRLKLNEKKLSSVSRKHRVKITGVTIASNRQISVGRERKRKLKAQIHKLRLGGLSKDEISSLRGMLAFVSSIEPKFITALKRKYGDELIKTLISSSEISSIGLESNWR